VRRAHSAGWKGDLVDAAITGDELEVAHGQERRMIREMGADMIQRRALPGMGGVGDGDPAGGAVIHGANGWRRIPATPAQASRRLHQCRRLLDVPD